MTDPIHFIDALLMIAGMSALIVGGVVAAFKIAAEWKREHWRERS